MSSSSNAEGLATILNILVKNEAAKKRDVIRSLSALADELVKHDFNTRIANLTFASTGIVATGFTVAGIVVAPLTFGASLGLTIGGMALGAASAAGAVGTTVVGRIIQSKAFEEANAARQEYTVTANMLLQIYTALKDDKEFLEQVLENMDFNGDVNAIEVARLTTLGAAGVIGGSMRLAAVASAIATRGIIDATTRTVTGVLKAGFLAVKIGGAVLSALTLPLDIYTIYTNSLDIHNMTTGEGAKQLYDAVEKLKETDLSTDGSPEQGLLNLMQGNSYLKAQFMCLVCYVQGREAIFMPCGHMFCCQGCSIAGRFPKCPMCLEDIDSVCIPRRDPNSEISACLQEVNDVTREQLIEMNRKLELKPRCMVCINRESNVLFLPCGHIMACSDCSHGLSHCPVCRKPVQDKERL